MTLCWGMLRGQRNCSQMLLCSNEHDFLTWDLSSWSVAALCSVSPWSFLCLVSSWGHAFLPSLLPMRVINTVVCVDVGGVCVSEITDDCHLTLAEYSVAKCLLDQCKVKVTCLLTAGSLSQSHFPFRTMIVFVLLWMFWIIGHKKESVVSEVLWQYIVSHESLFSFVFTSALPKRWKSASVLEALLKTSEPWCSDAFMHVCSVDWWSHS